MMTFKKIVFLIFYYAFARKLPRSTFPLLGPIFKNIRYFCCKRIFKQCGEHVNIERNAYFGSGLELEIGPFSALGVNCHVPNNISIGIHVMMAPDVLILKNNHDFTRTDISIDLQGVRLSKPVTIADDVWIGQRAIINPGRVISRGSIIAAGCVLVRDYPEYSMIGGNPSRLIRIR